MKIIVFGTGESCENYLKNYRDEHEIIALADWDEKKHGTSLFGLPVISPFEMKNLPYEKILIASYFVKEIESQLLERCGIERPELIIPEKYKVKDVVKPFEDEGTISFARELLVYFNNLFAQNKIDLFLEFGTLLGMVRDGDLIRWDDDIDFSVNEDDVEKMMNLILSEKSNLPRQQVLKWSCYVKEDTDGKIWYLSLNFKDTSQQLKDFEIAFGVRKFYNKLSVCMRGRYISCPSIHFEKHEVLKLKGVSYKVPFDYFTYLDLVYPNWNTPKEYTFGSDYGTVSAIYMDELKRKLTNKILF